MPQQSEKQLPEAKLDVSGCYRAGYIENFLESWKKITSDKFIINIVKNGIKSDFAGKSLNVPNIPYKLDKIKIFPKSVINFYKKEYHRM